MKYRIRAEQDGKWWVISSPDVRGANSQARRLNEVEEWGRDAIATVLEVPVDSFDVEVEVVLPAPLRDELEAARTAMAAATEQQERAARANRAVARELASALSLSGRDVARVMGISPQRAAQLLAHRPVRQDGREVLNA
jgi:predicted RNase H-like HicB family nuclease